MTVESATFSCFKACARCRGILFTDQHSSSCPFGQLWQVVMRPWLMTAFSKKCLMHAGWRRKSLLCRVLFPHRPIISTAATVRPLFLLQLRNCYAEGVRC